MSGALSRRDLLAAMGILGTAGVVAACRPPAERSPTRRPQTSVTASSFVVPLDSVPHKRTWMAWPDSIAIWGNRLLPGLQADIGRVANTIARYEPVIMCANPPSADQATKMCGPDVEVITTIPVDDCWMRDSGPVFRNDGAGGRDAIGLNFNGWGDGQVHEADQHVARLVAEAAAVPFSTAGFVGEGGAIETDGNGTLMATQSSLVNPERNPDLTQDRIEAAVLAAYGAQKMIWVPGVLDEDITDDHIDATSRFVEPAQALVQYPSGSGTNIWYEDQREQYEILSNSTDAHGRPIRVTKVMGSTWGKIRQREHANFVDSLVNYYVCNDAVISSGFGDEEADRAAREVLAAAYPGRKIEQLNTDWLGLGGGGIHCITQQEPAVIS